MNFIVTSLLQIINNPHANAVDQQIALFILENYTHITSLSITNLADEIGVSISQISRFVKYIGLSSFGDFKELLNYHGHISRHTYVQRGEISAVDYQKKVQEEMNYFFENFHLEAIRDFILDIIHYPRVALFGLLNSGNVARELQYNLASRQKICYCYDSLSDQLDFIKSADSNTVVIIVSMSGGYVMDNSYVRHYGAMKILKDCHAKVYVITQNKDVSYLSYIDHCILLPSLNPMYNLSLQWFIDLLLIEYDRLAFP